MDANTLASAMGCSSAVANRYVADFNVALRQANCTTVNRAAMYCAQIGHESVGLRYMEEIASGAAYEGRRDLGNIYPGDGKRFKGRGPIQLTGRHNYGKFGQWARGRGLVRDANYFVNNPHVVASSKWGFLAASWYWTVARPMNSYADRGDIYGASRAVNGGYNGIEDRIRRWNHCRSLGAALLPSRGSVTKPKKDPTIEEDFAMELPAGKGRVVYVPAVARPPYLYIMTGYGHKVKVHEITFLGPTIKAKNGTRARYLGQWKNRVWHADRPGPWRIPDGTVAVAIRYTSTHPATAIVG